VHGQDVHLYRSEAEIGSASGEARIEEIGRSSKGAGRPEWGLRLLREAGLKKKKQKSLRSLKAGAWALFSEYVRRKYADAEGYAYCYTSGVRAHWKELQCGHAIGGRHNAVLLDEEICRPQTVAENIFKRGNYPVFTAKLIRENGLEWFESKLEGARQIVKLTRSDYESTIESLKAKLEALA